MNQPDLPRMYDVLESTWPAATVARVGPWTIRDGQGGGQRASATTVEQPFAEADLDRAEAAMAALDQPRLFMIRDSDTGLDETLAARGYRIKDPVTLYSVAVGELTREPLPRVAAFTIWPPLAIITDLWAAAGIGPPRLLVMHRVRGAKTAILARHTDQPAGAAFVAIHDNIAMIHAIEVAPDHRRAGVGGNILRAAAFWAQDQGATHLTLAVTRANTGANALYTSLGMRVVGHYHYRTR